MKVTKFWLALSLCFNKNKSLFYLGQASHIYLQFSSEFQFAFIAQESIILSGSGLSLFHVLGFTALWV